MLKDDVITRRTRSLVTCDKTKKETFVQVGITLKSGQRSNFKVKRSPVGHKMSGTA